MDWYNKYIVIKSEDATKYLDNTLKHWLGLILDTIGENRYKDGKNPQNHYTVVNSDEDYSDIVERIVEMGEEFKALKIEEGGGLL